MIYKKILLLLLTVSIFINCSVLYAITNFEERKIVELRFKGLIQNDEITVKSVINTKVRSLYSQKTIDNDIKALYNLDLFDDIKVDVTEKDDGVIVTFIFKELLTIWEINIKGNKKVSDRTIKDEIFIKKGSVFKENDIYEDIQRIKKLYEDKGFPQAEVEFNSKPTKAKDKKTGEKINSVDLTFTIKEGKRLIINTLNFSGVKVVKEEKLKRLMKTRERGYIFSAGFFKENQFELDKREIMRYYGQKGYIDAEIIKIDKKVIKNEKKNRDEMYLTLYIREGKQYVFGGLDISGNKIFTNDEIYSLVKSKKNEVFNKTQLEADIQAIRNLLAENGFIYYSMDIKEKKDEINHVISYSIDIVENTKAHIEHIFITGNKKTKDFVIRREIDIREGEIFNAKKIQRSREKLYNLQYFSAVNVDLKPGSELGLADLIFNVEEQRTGLFSFGLSYSTAGYGVSLFEEVSANNFLGKGIKLHEKVNVGFTNQSVEAGIDEPWLFNTPTSAGFTLSWSRTEYDEDDYVYVDNNEDNIPDGTSVNADGSLDYSKAQTMNYVNSNYKTALRFGRRFAKYYGLNSEIAFSVFQNNPETDDRPYDISLQDQFEDKWPWYWKNYLSLTAYRDTRDSIIFATKGTYLSQNITFYGGPLGGYSNFIKLNTEMNANTGTFWKFVLSGRLNFGFIYPFLGKDLTVDDSDYIRIDCMNEGRGWQNSSTQWGDLYSIRGKSELNFSLEHRFPIEERILWGLTFFDISNIYSKPEDFKIDFKDFYYSFGLGISFVIPGFPIRLYLTKRFKYDKDLNKMQFANSQKLLKDWDFVFAVAGFF